MEYFIWWLSPLEINVIEVDLRNDESFLPAHLEAQLRSAQGKNGCGRLWDAHRTNLSVEPWPDNTLGRYCSECAGLVVDHHDAAFLRNLPGLLTNFKLEKVRR